MRGAEARSALLAALLCACSPRPQPSPEAHVPRPPPAVTHHLDEPFPLAGLSCRLRSAELALSEPRVKPVGRAAEDISLVDTALRCSDEQGAEVSLQALPLRLRWLDEARVQHAPSKRSALAEREPEHALFEVPARLAGIPRPRRYDAQSGEPRGRREQGSARLLLDELDERGRVAASWVIAPWPRFARRDGFLDRLVRTLASDAPFDTLSDSQPGHDAIRTAAALYGRVAPHAKQVRVSELSAERVTLSLERGREPLLRLRFATSSGDEPKVTQLLDDASAHAEARCVEDHAELARRLARASVSARDCNVLGVLLPGGCAEADAALVHDALQVGVRCSPPLPPTAAAPADFSLRLSRGRSLASNPRYTLTIASDGLVRFEDERGAREGRTSPQLVGALHATLTRMGWLERPEPSARSCHKDLDRGDSFDVHARGRGRMLRDREGCRGGLSAGDLAQLRGAIERVAGVEPWIADSSLASSRRSEIWMVAAE